MEKITGIVLNVRKYNDRNCIVTLYTRERGRMSFISPDGTGKASKARRARLQPLSLISTEINFKASSELQRLGTIATPEVWTDTYFHPVKRVMALFISEFLYRLLNAAMPDLQLFDFLSDSLRLLDNMKEGAHEFHIPFLISLLSYSGIQPDLSGFQPGKVFDFAAGAYIKENEAKGPVVTGVEAEAINWICRINFRNMKCLRLSNVNRRQILYGILNYYSYHFPGLSTLKSVEILRSLTD